MCCLSVDVVDESNSKGSNHAKIGEMRLLPLLKTHHHRIFQRENVGFKRVYNF